MTFTEDERSMVLDALQYSRQRWKEIIDKRRELVHNPEEHKWRSEHTRKVDKEILERFYVLFGALDSAYEKVDANE